MGIPKVLVHVFESFASDLDHIDEDVSNVLRQGASDATIAVLDHLLSAPGKRMRPLLCLMSARLLGWNKASSSEALTASLLQVSTALELIHLASLIHDDVIDRAQTRRDQDTLNQRWGNETAVAMGVYVYSVALSRIADVGILSVLAPVSEAVRRMCDGELYQLADRGRVMTDVKRYFKVIDSKTASFFGASCECGGLVMLASSEQKRLLTEVGRLFGIIFQLTDDYLDLFGDGEALSKKEGQDYFEGQPTLPILYALEALEGQVRDDFLALLLKRDETSYKAIKKEVVRLGGDQRLLVDIDAYYKKAVSCLMQFPESSDRTMFVDVLSFVRDRVRISKV